MNHFLRGVVRALTESFLLDGPVLEVGSLRVPGQEHSADVRAFFPGRCYTGIDIRPGPGVDALADVEELPHADASFGTVLALNSFEHVRRFWRGFEEVHRVLRPDGALVVSCPFFFRIHEFPGDYWRFTPQALEVLLADYPTRIIGWHGPRQRPAHVWALAFRERRGPITEAQFQTYAKLLARYAREPASGFRRLRYRLAGLLCSRGPFAPYLDRNRWETVCQNPSVQSFRLNPSPLLHSSLANER
jgi:SAM-dependent methyltransferase